jgi:outer membrane protein
MRKIVRNCQIVALAAMLFLVPAASSFAAGAGIAVLSIQDVLTKSSAGRSAKRKMERKMQELRRGLENDKDELIALREEMKKKASVWSEDKKQEENLEFQKKRNALSVKQDNANLEMRNLEKRYLNPIMEKLEEIVKEVASRKGYTVVLPSTSSLYFSNSVDITNEVINTLNRRMR